MGRLEGKTALVTGGGSGIGRAIARRLHAEGAHVLLCGRSEQRLEAAIHNIAPGGERIGAVAADVTAEKDIERIRESVVDLGNRLDILVNCAGAMRFSPLEQTKPEVMQSLFEVNTFAPWRLSTALAAELAAGGGAIINIASINGMRPFPGSGAYCMSKAALIMMSQVMALEWAERKVRVNCICPGMVEDTDLGNEIFSPAQVQASYDRFRPLHPLGRNGSPEDVAEAALFLASPASEWITGAVLPLDGGRHLTTNSPD